MADFTAKGKILPTNGAGMMDAKKALVENMATERLPNG